MKRSDGSHRNINKNKVEQFLQIPYRLLRFRQMNLGCKTLYAHIYGFGRQGCWQTNEQIGQLFNVTLRTVTRWMTVLKQKKFVLYVFPNGPERVVWAKYHPDVQTANTLPYRGQELPKADVVNGLFKRPEPRQNVQVTETECPGDVDKTNTVTATNCPPIKTSIKESIKESIIAPPAPLPAGGQASAVLAERKAQTMGQVEQAKQTFGRRGRRAAPRPTPAELEQRKQQQIKALLQAEK